MLVNAISKRILDYRNICWQWNIQCSVKWKIWSHDALHSHHAPDACTYRPCSLLWRCVLGIFFSFDPSTVISCQNASGGSKNLCALGVDPRDKWIKCDAMSVRIILLCYVCYVILLFKLWPKDIRKVLQLCLNNFYNMKC